MKNCDTNPNTRRWDTYRTFHWTVSPNFIQFESGELIYTDARPDPDFRNTIDRLGVQIVSTTDPECPTLLLPDGEPIRKAWLTRGGMQYLAIDLDLMVAVQLQPTAWGRTAPTDADRRAPAYLQGRFSAYWAGPGRMPVGNPVSVSTPLKLDEDQQKHIDSVLAQCDAWCAMHDIERKSWSRTVDLPGKASFQVRQHSASPRWLLGKTFADLKYSERVELRDFGLAPAFDVKTYDYLRVRG
jgi:hypothetical protein